MKKNFEFLLLGTVLGSILGMMLTSDSFKKIRKDFMSNMNNQNCDRWMDSFHDMVQSIEDGIVQFEEEDVLDRAKEKAKDLLDKADSLVDFAMNRGDLMFEKIANDTRKKAIKVTKLVLKNLENGN